LPGRVSNEKSSQRSGQVFTVGSAIDWLIENKLLDSVSQIDKLPIDTNGVFSTPGFAGYGAPRWLPHGTASINGLTLGSTRYEIARAVLNGIAAQVTELIEVMAKDGSQIRQMRVDGGLTQSKTFMQFQADLAQVEIELFPHPDATAVGVGILGTMATNKYETIKSALPQG
jgi:glycerol kinase